MDPIIDWEARYQAKATGWERGAVNPAFELWQEEWRKDPGVVLVPGCGRAPEVVALAKGGWEVIALDIAESAVKHQQARLQAENVQVRVEQANVLAWQPDSPVDAVYEQTCLCALHPEHWPAYEAQLYRWLKQGGRLMALFMQTQKEGGPPFHCAVAKMQTLFPAERWLWPEHMIESDHPMGIHEVGYVLVRR
jgi:cyclopropane fatty-acyl-phospholipid synthase-like methyltransferase